MFYTDLEQNMGQLMDKFNSKHQDIEIHRFSIKHN